MRQHPAVTRRWIYRRRIAQRRHARSFAKAAQDFGRRLPLPSLTLGSLTPPKRLKLSPAGPMVLHAKVCGSVGSCRHK
jgi:hypothetical protein